MTTFLILLVAIGSALVVATIQSARHDRPTRRPPLSHYRDGDFVPPAQRL